MNHLHDLLAQNVADWRDSAYRCADYPAIAELLNFATTENGNGELRYLRRCKAD